MNLHPAGILAGTIEKSPSKSRKEWSKGRKDGVKTRTDQACIVSINRKKALRHASPGFGTVCAPGLHNPLQAACS
jgi:hypothetical protein